MFTPFERMIAGRYLRSKKQEGFVSVIAGFSFTGIMLGVATLIIVMAVMNGFRQELFSRILGLNGHMNVYAVNRPFTDYEPVRQIVDRMDGIDVVLPVVDGQALLTSEGAASGVLVQGLSAGSLQKKPILADALVAGDYTDFGENRILIGVQMSARLGVGIGEKITLVAPKGKASPFGTIPRSRSYTVAGIFDVGMFEYNANYIFMPLDAAQRFFQLGNTVTSLEIFTDDPQARHMERYKSKIKILTEGRVSVSDWQDLNSNFFNALQVERHYVLWRLSRIIRAVCPFRPEFSYPSRGAANPHHQAYSRPAPAHIA